MSRTAQPAFAQPLSELSLNRSNRHRIHAIRAAIQMKNQKLHNRTSPKSVVIPSIVIPSRDRLTRRDERWPSASQTRRGRAGGGGGVPVTAISPAAEPMIASNQRGRSHQGGV